MCVEMGGYIQPIAVGVSFNLNLQPLSPWSLFHRLWQKRPRELEHQSRFEIEEMTHSKCNMQYNVCNDVLSCCMLSYTHTHTYAQPRTFSLYSAENESMCVRVMGCRLSYIHTFSKTHRDLFCTSRVDRTPCFSFPDSRYTKTHARARPNIYVCVPDMYTYRPPSLSFADSLYTHTHEHTHTHTHTHTNTHTHTYTHNTHTHTHTNICTYKTYTPTAHTYTQIHTQRIHTHTQIHAHTKHTHEHTRKYVFS